MSDADRAVLLRAAELRRPIARAARIGAGNGLGYVLFGGLSVLFVLADWDLVGLVLGAVLLAVGLSERAQSTRLLRGDADAPLRLARGELALFGTLVLYAVLGLTVLPTGADELQRQLGNTKGLGIDVQGIARMVSTGWYGTVMVTALLYQGGMARYFLRRRADVALYLAEVPAWARAFVEAMP